MEVLKKKKIKPIKNWIGEYIGIFWTINDPTGLEGLTDGILEDIGIFWAINDPTGLRRVKRRDTGRYRHILDHKRPCRESKG